nr:MAG TPA: hypothetical protein [Bacteriophage sp.]
MHYLGHRGIDARTIVDCYTDCTFANYEADTAQHHIVLHQRPTGRSLTTLNRIVLVGRGLRIA